MAVRSERYYRSPSRSPAPNIYYGPGGTSMSSFLGPSGTPVGNRQGALTMPQHQIPLGPTGVTQVSDPFKYIQGASGTKDPLEAFLEQMQGGMGTGVGGSPRFASDADLIAQARAEAAAQFNPQIAALGSASARAKSETAYNKSAVDQLYDQLAASYGPEIAGVKSNYKGTVGTEKALHKQAAKEIAGAYTGAEQDLANTMSQLGIEEAAPAVLPGIAKDQARRIADEAARSATEQGAYNQQRQGELSYYKEGPSLAHMGGAEGQSALQQQLNQFLLDQEAQRAQLESQRTLTERATLGGLRSDAAKQYNDWLGNQQQAQNQQFGQFSDIFGMMLQLKRFQFEQQQAQNKPAEPLQPGTQAAAQVISQYKPGDAPGGQKLMQDFQTVLGMNPLVDSYPGALYTLKQFAAQQKISPTDLNTLSQALAAYFGKY